VIQGIYLVLEFSAWAMPTDASLAVILVTPLVDVVSGTAGTVGATGAGAVIAMV
jgi:hypothetical protein